MRIAYENLIDDLASTAITASSEDTSYPVTNVQDQRLTTKWYSDSTTTQTVTFEFDTFPEFPDNASTTSYIQTAWSTVDSWSATLATLSVTNYTGILTVTATSNASAYITRTGLTISASSAIKIKARSQLSSTMTILNSAGSTLGTITGMSSTFSILGVTTATSATTLNIYTNNATTGVAVEIDGIYTGTGGYSTAIEDLSGNGNDATVYGATPVDGVSGKAIELDGLGDYIKTTGSFSMPDIFTMSLWTNNVQHATQVQIVWSYGTTGAPRFTGYRNIASNSLFLLWYDSVGTKSTEIANVFSNDGDDHHYIFSINYDTGVFTAYRDGVLVSNTTLSGILKPGTFALYFGIQQALTVTQALGGTFDEVRIYNREPTAEEVARLSNLESFDTESDGLIAWYSIDSDKRISVAAVMSHNLLASSTVRIEGNNSDAWDDPELSETIEIPNGDKMGLTFLDDFYIYKYWRFYFDGAGNYEIGRLWLGEYETISPSSLEEFTVTKKRDDIVVYGHNRQKYASVGHGWRAIEFTFPRTSMTTLSVIQTLYDTVGNHSSFIFCNFDSLRTYNLVEPIYCSISGDVGFSHSTRQFYTYGLSLEEDR